MEKCIKFYGFLEWSKLLFWNIWRFCCRQCEKPDRKKLTVQTNTFTTNTAIYKYRLVQINLILKMITMFSVEMNVVEIMTSWHRATSLPYTWIKCLFAYSHKFNINLLELIASLHIATRLIYILTEINCFFAHSHKFIIYLLELTASLHIATISFENPAIFSAVFTASFKTWSTGKTLLTKPKDRFQVINKKR